MILEGRINIKVIMQKCQLYKIYIELCRCNLLFALKYINGL